MSISRQAPGLRKSRGLGSHDNGGTRAHIDIVIKTRILQLCRENADAPRFQEADAIG